MTKQERKIIDRLVAYLDRIISPVSATKQALLDKVEKSPYLPLRVHFSDSTMTWDRQRVLTEIKLLSEANFQILRAELQALERKHTKEQDLAHQLESALKERFPGEDLDVDEFVQYDRRTYGVKIYLCGKGYLFEYQGSFKQLLADLIEEVEENRRSER